jgi:hypothetical protein
MGGIVKVMPQGAIASTFPQPVTAHGAPNPQMHCGHAGRPAPGPTCWQFQQQTPKSSNDAAPGSALPLAPSIGDGRPLMPG